MFRLLKNRLAIFADSRGLLSKIRVNLLNLYMMVEVSCWDMSNSSISLWFRFMYSSFNLDSFKIGRFSLIISCLMALLEKSKLIFYKLTKFWAMNFIKVDIPDISLFAHENSKERSY